jgi:hypothetical protein
MDFGGLLEGLLANRSNPFTGGGGLPQIKTNMAPPANFWEGNEFKIGAPGLQETPVSDPSHPANPATPAPTPQQPPANFTPPPAQVDPRQAYLDQYPDLMRAYQSQNIASSPHLLGGGGKGTDVDGNGTISPLEFAQFHYNTAGQSEGRQWGAPAASPQQSQPSTVGVGGGAYMPGGATNPLLPGAASPQQAPSAANPYLRPGAKWQQGGYSKNPFLTGSAR